MVRKVKKVVLDTIWCVILLFIKYYKCKGIKMTLKHNYSKEISEFIKANDKRLNLNWGIITELNQLGQGGSGLVYSGKYEDFEVVIKFFNKELDSRDEIRFKNEYFKIQHLENHEKMGIAAYMNFECIEFNEHKFYFYIMKKYKETLKSYMDRYTGDREILFVQILDFFMNALRPIYRYKIIHRDLKPENILIDEKECFYLADFGIAKFIDSELTRNHDRMANYRFSAPEQKVDGASSTIASDMYAIGQILFWILEKHTYEGTIAIKDYKNHRIKPLLYAFLAYDPQERPNSIEELEDLINTIDQGFKEDKLNEERMKFAEKAIDLNQKYTVLIRKCYPHADNNIVYVDSADYIDRIIQMIDEFIKEQYEKQNSIWFSTGHWDQELIGIRYNKSDKIIQIQVSHGNIIEFKLKGIWLFASPSEYNSIIWLDAEQLPFYLINGDKSSSMSIVNNKYHVKTEETYSGFLELGPNSKPVPITNVLTYERLLPCGKNIVIGPRLSAALFVDNIDYLDRLQKSKIDISILDTYLREINKNKPKDFYYYL